MGDQIVETLDQPPRSDRAGIELAGPAPVDPHPRPHLGWGGVAETLSMVAQRQPGESVEALTERADAALYRAKSEGRNRTRTAELTEMGVPLGFAATRGA